MAKMNKSQKFARSFKVMSTGESMAQSLLVEAVKNYHANKGNPAQLSFVYTGLTIANQQGYLRPAQEKAVNTFINAFCGVKIEKNVDGSDKFDSEGNKVLKKDQARHNKALKAMEIVEGTAQDEINSIVQASIEKYIGERNGSIFNAKKAKKSDEKNNDEKVKAFTETRCKKFVKDANGLNMAQIKKAQMLLEMAKGFGFADLAELQGVIDSAITGQ